MKMLQTKCQSFFVKATYECYLKNLEQMHISKELKDEFGGGNKEFVFDDMNCWYYCNIVDHPLPTVYNVLLKDVKMCFT